MSVSMKFPLYTRWMLTFCMTVVFFIWEDKIEPWRQRYVGQEDWGAWEPELDYLQYYAAASGTGCCGSCFWLLGLMLRFVRLIFRFRGFAVLRFCGFSGLCLGVSFSAQMRYILVSYRYSVYLQI